MVFLLPQSYIVKPFATIPKGLPPTMLALVNWGAVHLIPLQAVHFKDMRLELSGSPVLVTASGEYGFLGNGSYMYINFNDEDFPREDVDCFLMGRGLGKCKY